MPVVTAPERHVAVFAFPIASHPGLLLSLVRRLATAAPTVTFSFFNTAKSNRSLFSVPTPHNIKPYDVSDGIPVGYVFAGKPQEDINLFLAVAEDEFRRSLQVAEGETGKGISCLVADAFLWFSSEMAEKRRVPWVPLWTSGASSLSIHFYTDLIRQTVGLNGIEGRKDEMLDFIPGFSAVRLGDLPGGVLSGNLESPFSIMLYKMGQCLTKATAIPINSFQEMDPEINKDLNKHFSNFLNIGPFNLISPTTPLNTDEFACIPWLDKHLPQSVAYIGFGTVATPPPHELVALAEALEESGTPFLWSINENSKKHLPEGFLERTGENGKLVPWAPQVQVLAHGSVGVFITHGGWNSVVESIGAGVPLIMRPFFGEQQLNTWMVENVWRIGVRVKGGVFTRSGTVQALEEVLLHQKGKKLKEQVVVFKELAHKAVGPSGSSTENFKTLIEIITNMEQSAT
uniref:Glycosyltransferase n=1 Tax=Lobelia erinus TaxID=16430 RepID=A4F1S9_LOBER|nr:UDP-glucose:anthocyanidin 3-O-glucosyltransferase [Lobelia erinus]